MDRANWQAEADRRSRIRWHLSTNDGSIEICGTPNWREREPDGTPMFLTRLNINGGYSYAQVELTDRMLVNLFELLARFIDRPQPPISVRVELVAPSSGKEIEDVVSAPPAAAGDVDPEKDAIKARMLAGR